MDIITELYETHFVENYARKIAGELDKPFLDDIIGDLYVMICEQRADTIQSIYNGCGINCFRRYVSGLIVRQMKSTNSKVWRKYKKNADKTQPLSTVTNLEEYMKRWEENEKC